MSCLYFLTSMGICLNPFVDQKFNCQSSETKNVSKNPNDENEKQSFKRNFSAESSTKVKISGSIVNSRSIGSRIK